MPHADPEVRRAYYRSWKKGSKKKLSNKFYDAAKHANARARKYGVEGTITTADVRAVLDGATCSYCGTAERLCLDHRVPLARGGPNLLPNLVASCIPCNAKKYLADRPGRWATKFEECVICHSNARPHAGHGQCQRCYLPPCRKNNGRRRSLTSSTLSAGTISTSEGPSGEESDGRQLRTERGSPTSSPGTRPAGSPPSS